MLSNLEKKFTPIQIISSGFIIIIALGAVLLSMPLSSADSTYQNFLDALFTSTSAVTTTGLIVVDTGSYYSLFGEVVILLLIQVGGLGYMIIFVLIALILKSRFTITGKKYVRESVSRITKVDVIKFVKLTTLFTVSFEIIGTILYSLVFVDNFNTTDAIYLSLFHSISAFCTAGFSLFADSLSSYGSDWLVNFNTFFLVIGGSIGFFVIYDLLHYIKSFLKRNPINKISLHSKVVLSTSITLYATGIILLFVLEGNKFSNAIIDRIFYSAFQAITASSTVGFNTIDIASLTQSSLFLIIILMFIGGSPGSTAGGIKTISLIVFSKFSLSTLSESKNVSLFKRSVNPTYFNKAASQIFIAVISLSILIFTLTATESFDFIKIMFEAVSAFGTIGLSTGITPHLSSMGKIAIIILMLIGRIGPLIIGLSLIPKSTNNNYMYPEEEIIIS